MTTPDLPTTEALLAMAMHETHSPEPSYERLCIEHDRREAAQFLATPSGQALAARFDAPTERERAAIDDRDAARFSLGRIVTWLDQYHRDWFKEYDRYRLAAQPGAPEAAS